MKGLLSGSLENYSWGSFRKDLIAGVIVGIIAIPLAMAFAIASGVKPEYGIYTFCIAGVIISLLGGSKFQIGGPYALANINLHRCIGCRHAAFHECEHLAKEVDYQNESLVSPR